MDIKQFNSPETVAECWTPEHPGKAQTMLQRLHLHAAASDWLGPAAVVGWEGPRRPNWEFAAEAFDCHAKVAVSDGGWVCASHLVRVWFGEGAESVAVKSAEGWMQSLWVESELVQDY